MVRRMKTELKLRGDGSRRFAERVVKHLEVPYTEEERQAHRALQQYSAHRLKEAASQGERMATEFVLKLLKKRLFSSPAAFGLTLEKHIATVGGRKAATTVARDIDDFSDDYADDDEYEAQTDEIVGSASQVLSPISIVCHFSLQVQWKEEMRDKFGLESRIIDSEAISNLRRKARHPRQPVVTFSTADHIHRLPQAGTATAHVPRNSAGRRPAHLPAGLRPDDRR